MFCNIRVATAAPIPFPPSGPHAWFKSKNVLEIIIKNTMHYHIFLLILKYNLNSSIICKLLLIVFFNLKKLSSSFYFILLDVPTTLLPLYTRCAYREGNNTILCMISDSHHLLWSFCCKISSTSEVSFFLSNCADGKYCIFENRDPVIQI